MKNLIIYAHPNPASFNKAVKDRVLEVLEKNGDTFVLRDLNKIEFNPILSADDFGAFQAGTYPDDINTEQQYIKEADVITFIFPIWWAGMPAILKGYIDRVFSYGFAYQYGADGAEGLLNDKKVILINTTGTPEEKYNEVGMFEAFKKTMDMNIFNFCGIEVLHHKYYTAIPSSTPEERAFYLKDIESLFGAQL